MTPPLISVEELRKAGFNTSEIQKYYIIADERLAKAVEKENNSD